METTVQDDIMNPFNYTAINLDQFDPANFKSKKMYKHDSVGNCTIPELMKLANNRQDIYPSILHMVQTVQKLYRPEKFLNYERTGICSFQVKPEHIRSIYPSTNDLPLMHVDLLTYMCSNLPVQKSISRLIHQIEHWFGEISLSSDDYLQYAMDKYGFVAISIIKKFKRISKFQVTSLFIQIAAFLSLNVDLCDTFCHIRSSSDNYKQYARSRKNDPSTETRQYSTFTISSLTSTHLHPFSCIDNLTSCREHGTFTLIDANLVSYNQKINHKYTDLNWILSQYAFHFMSKIQVLFINNEVPELKGITKNKSKIFFGYSTKPKFSHNVVKRRHPNRTPMQNIYWFLKNKNCCYLKAISLTMLIGHASLSSFKTQIKSQFYQFAAIYLRKNFYVPLFKVMKQLAILDFEMDQREGIEYLHEMCFFILCEEKLNRIDFNKLKWEWCDIIDKDIYRGNTYCVKYVKKYELNNTIVLSKQSRQKIYQFNK
ncbi:hypothetical protein A3Q56_03509 [Intoshia linei]|uniref:HTH La-type RNA-binding domain-containing protein n=1 Tax=Intoshia linei TaxID=1819745 RepID=A0A177B3A6_9BILA|nr:hypothetical protein A3Q56_03509 [Intoshia linei]